MKKKVSINSAEQSYSLVRRLFMWVLIGFITGPVFSQSSFRVSGVCLSATDKQPLIGVNIMATKGGNGAITDQNGNFGLILNAPTTLKVSYIGFLSQEIKVSNAQKDLRIILKEDNMQLNEVVVVGYGVQKKKLLTGATVQVNGDEMEKLNTVNPLGALQSKTPGVSIVQNSGMPGAGYKVTVRGLGTTGDFAPLYIIDGVTNGDINSLNPSDIESVDVLKDAASAAIYGSRAANGVILITTKQGHSGKAQLTYDGYVGVQNVYRMPDLLNAKEYAMIMNEGRMEDGLTPYDFSSLVPNWDKIEDGTWKGTNWMEEIRNKNAIIQNHAINISGGNDRSTYSIGLSYTYQDGTLGKPVEPNYTRYTVRINTDHKLFNKGNFDLLTFGENMTYTYTEKRGISNGDMWSNDIRNMLITSPFLPNKDDDGDYHNAISWDIREPNPIAKMVDINGNNKDKAHNVRAALYAILEPVKDLKFKTNFGFTFSADSYRSYVPTYKLSSNVLNDQDIVNQSMSMGCTLMWENTGTYNFKIGKDNNFTALLGQSIEVDGLGESMSGTNTNSIFSDFNHAYLSNTPTISLTNTKLSGSPWGRQTIASFFGRMNWDYQGRYMATAVLRADGSSKFAEGHRWGYFPSISAGWIMSEEPFMNGTKSWMDFLKLRASWGQNGNQSIPSFQYLSTISFSGANYTFGTDKSTVSTGAYPDILANSDITWEVSEQTDLGFDARFLNDRLGMNFDYYIKTTKGWLVQAPVLDTTGTNAPYVNGGNVQNKGFEVAMTWNDHIADFKYGASMNLAYNKNKVTRIDNSEGIIHGASDILSNSTDEMYRAQVGYPIGFFYGYKTAGIFQNQAQIDNYKGAKLSGTIPGDVIWVDRNKDGVIDENDKGMIGDPHPDYSLGLGLNFSWKGFDVSATMNGVFGNQIMKSYRSFVDYPTNNYTSAIFKRWHGEGTSNFLPRLTSGTHSNWQNISDLYMENGDYMRMQNLTIGYDLKKLFKGLPMQQMRIYFAAQNLFTITRYSGMDPEIGYGGSEDWVSGVDLGSYPSPRTYMIGVNAKF
ncbi:MAG: TonB-dependent receptor [Bacteroidaceae bacterium]